MTLTIRLLVALGLTWAIGFERELRGAAAGDRTFALIGVGSAVIGYLALDHAPNALAGVVTGIGFIGAGLIVHGALPNRPGAPDGADVDVDAGNRAIGRIRGVTTAATIYLAAAVGAAAGQGSLLLAFEATIGCLLLLEVRHLRALRFLDGRFWRHRLHLPDDDPADL
ncbi:MAG: MgtC/SapB family protein [Microthrixaceae bacterium]|jgi:putative Mg2+ transporter-C (MgtC) family protein